MGKVVLTPATEKAGRLPIATLPDIPYELLREGRWRSSEPGCKSLSIVLPSPIGDGSSQMREMIGEIYSALFPRAWMRRRLADHHWDEVEAQYLDIMVDPHRAAVDVGANDGKYAYRLADLASKVYAIEPDPALARKIRRALPSNVSVHAVAASDRPGTAELHFPLIRGKRSTALASIEPGVAMAEGYGVVTIEVPMVRLDALVEGPVGFMKIDVEGHELSALHGASGFLERDQPFVMVEAEERHRPNAVASVRDYMRSLGYVGFFLNGCTITPIDEFSHEFQNTDLLDPRLPRVQMKYVNNFLFVPSKDADGFSQQMALAIDASSQ